MHQLCRRLSYELLLDRGCAFVIRVWQISGSKKILFVSLFMPRFPGTEVDWNLISKAWTISGSSLNYRIFLCTRDPFCVVNKGLFTQEYLRLAKGVSYT